MGNGKLARTLHPDLRFLLPFLDSHGPRYQTASWLGPSKFDDHVWHVQSANAFLIDWRISIGKDGELLTSSRHSKLWEVLRSWLILQTHVDSTGGVKAAARVEYTRLRRVLAFSDYFIINADRLGLTRHGMASLSRNDLVGALAQIGSNRAVSKAVYEWPRRLGDYLREQSATLTQSELRDAIQSMPLIAADIVHSAERLTTLDDKEIVLARAWLWLSGAYKRNRSAQDFRFTPNTKVLASEIYANTLAGAAVKITIPLEFCLEPRYSFSTEYPRAPIVSERDERMERGKLASYRDVLVSLSLLRGEGLSVPRIGLPETNTLVDALDLKDSGRYRTLPHDVVFLSLRKAIEYALEYGDALVQSYLSLAQKAKSKDQTIASYAASNDITPLLSPRAKKMGIRTWTFEGVHLGASLSGAEYYSRLRANVGLYHSLIVLYGAIQIVVGTLMARREGELSDLIAGQCLDASRTRLVFSNRKSGLMGYREKEARAIPPVAVMLIELLEGLQDGLTEAGIINKHTNLFSTPRRLGKADLVFSCYNHNLDTFCDWAELPTNRHGQRYYIRQHQLRRYFAMLFFWGNGFGGLETLRYFMGHTDSKHLYRYITESIPGTVLRGVKAQYVSYELQHSVCEADDLSDILFQHFGTKHFEMIDSLTLENYIEDLIEDGRVQVEPEFLDSGKQYRILVKVIQARVFNDE